VCSTEHLNATHTDIPHLSSSAEHYTQVVLASGLRATPGSQQLNIPDSIICKCAWLETRRMPAVVTGKVSAETEVALTVLTAREDCALWTLTLARPRSGQAT
jgi:hypothetical protein